MYYLLDDSVDEVKWSDIEKVNHFDSNETYRKLLLEINECLGPKTNLFLNFDYESMKLLLRQAEDFQIPFIQSNDLISVFISKNRNPEVRQRLYEDYGYTEGKKVAKVMDLHQYKRIYNTLKESMDMDSVEKCRKIVLEEVLSDALFPLLLRIDPDKYILDVEYYFDNHSNERSSWDTSKLFYLDLISEYFFDDYYENVSIDIRQMMKFIKLTNNHDIPRERLEFYQDFLMIESLSFQEQQEFFISHKGLSIMEGFYDDMRLLKDISYQSLVDACTTFSKSSPLYNQEMSDTYGCDVYYLDGEEFFGFVRSDIHIKKKRLSSDYTVEDAPVPVGDDINRLGHSFTYIGKDDIQTYKDPNEVLTMLYGGIDYRSIGHVYHNDSWTNPDYYYYSDYQNELHTPESLLQESTKYPEILITNLEGIRPTAIIVLDEVTPWDVEFSKKNHLPIVVINSKKYERKHAPENYRDDHYVR